MTRFLIAALVMMLAAPAMAEDVASATSPGGTLKVDLSLNGEGRVGYRISRSGKSIIDESHLGFLFTDAPQMLRTFKLVSSTTHDVSTSWEQPWGEWRTVADRHRELDATFEETGPLHRRMAPQAIKVTLLPSMATRASSGITYSSSGTSSRMER